MGQGFWSRMYSNSVLEEEAGAEQNGAGVSGRQYGRCGLQFESELTVYGWLMCACAGILEEILIFLALGLSFSFVPPVISCFIAVLLTILNGGMMVALDELIVRCITVQISTIREVHQVEL